MLVASTGLLSPAFPKATGDSLIMNRIDYIRGCIGDRSYPEFAQELGVTPHAIAQWFTATKNRRQPSDITVRAIQLIEFIREAGLEPPPPLN